MKTPKKIYIENIEEFNFLLSLESKIKGISIQNLIEKHIFNDIIKTDNARIYISCFIKRGMNNALEKIFLDIYEEKDLVKFELNNLKRLFDFALKQVKFSVSTTNDKDNIYGIMQLFLELIYKIENWLKCNKCESEENVTLKLKYNNFKKLYNEMLNFYQNANTENDLEIERNIWTYLSKSWELVGCELVTYKLLAQLESVKGSYNRSDTLDWEFIELINDITQ